MKAENRFEVFSDIDVDGAVFQVGLQHAMLGPPRPAIHIGTGAVDVMFNVHCSDLDATIKALKTARKALRSAGVL